MAEPASAQRTIPAPIVYPDNAAFWDATGAGRLLVKHCVACGKPHWYPRPQCPLCLSDRTEWKESAGQGSIYAFSVCRRVGPVPYVIAYVRLDDGITLLTNIVDCDFESLRIGDRVRLVMQASESGVQVPMFTPAQRAPG